MVNLLNGYLKGDFVIILLVLFATHCEINSHRFHEEICRSNFNTFFNSEIVVPQSSANGGAHKHSSLTSYYDIVWK